MYLPVAAVAVALRAIPEVLAGKYPVGFDTLATYPYLIQSFPNWTLNTALAWGPLFFGLSWELQHLTGASVLLLLKFLGPVLYGIFSVSFAVFLKRYLAWGPTPTLAGSLILISQPVTLRMSWDLFRNELGLSLVLFSLVAFKSTSRYRGYFLMGLSLLVVLTHQLSSVVLFTAAAGILLFGSEKKIRQLILALAPSAVLFLITIYLQLGLSSSSWFDPTSSQRVLTLDSGPSLLSNVFSQDFRFSNGSNVDVLAFVGVLFLYCFVPLMFWIMKGVFHEPALTTLTVFLLIGSFSVLVFPTTSIPLYWRWEIMLVIPFAIYSTYGLVKFSFGSRKHMQLFKMFLVLYTILGIGYASGFVSYMYGPAINSYVPSTMVQSSVRMDQVGNISPTFLWLNTVAPSKANLVTDERFYALAMMTARPDIRIVLNPGGRYSHSFFENLRANNGYPIFVVDNTDPIVEGLTSLHSQGDISIFGYQS